MAEIIGATIEGGVSDWQVFQQDKNGLGRIAVTGRWQQHDPAEYVEVRLVREEANVPVTSGLDWQRARTRRDGTWSAVLPDIPAGGLYRLETHLRYKNKPATEWSQRGDMRHFLGVGDLWIIGGQSNSAGYGRGPCYDPPELGVHVFNNAMRWALASQPMNESTDTVHPANREVANSGHAPWLHWARLVKRQVGFPIGLIQTSLGGSPLRAWNPAEPGGHPLYETMIQVVQAAGGAVRGMLWYQGCSDAGIAGAKTYPKRFVAAARAWRKALKNPSMPILTVQINRVLGRVDEKADRAWSILRDAQRLAPHRLKGVTVTPTLDLAMTDFIHTSPFGNLLLAERVAAAALGAVYGRPVDYLAPEAIRAKADRRGRTITIEFAHVCGRMDCVDPKAVSFRVEDQAGSAAVKRVEYTLGKTVKLHLARALEGKAVVHGAYGCNPPAAPYDMDRVMPMLGFYGLAVESGSSDSSTRGR